MPRPTQQSVNKVPSVESAQPQSRLEVAARPVDAPAFTRNDSSLTNLLSGLSKFNSKLSDYVNGQADRDVEEGMRARADGAPLDDNKGEWFKHGYMVLEGAARGMEDANALRQQYETGFDREAAPNVEKLISDTWAKNTAGLADKSYLHGYAQTFEAAANKLRQDHAEFQRKSVLDRMQANATATIDATVRGYVERGEEVPQAELEKLKEQFRQFGIDRGRFSELLFDVVNRHGMENGNFQLFDLFKRDNADGTKGAYFIPRFKERIDAAQVAAQNVFLQRQSQAYELAKRQRDERQDVALYGVFEKLYSGDQDGAQVEFGQHVKNGLFSRASDIVKWKDMFSKVETREMRPDEQAAMTEALAGVVTGKLGIRDILSLELPPKGKRELLSEWRTSQAQQRQLEAQGATAENRPFTSHAFREQESWLEDNLAPSQDLMGQFTKRNDFIRGQRASAKLELAEYVRANGLQDIRSKTVELVKRYQERIQGFDENRLDLSAKTLRYSTMGEAQAAYDRHELSLEELARHLEYFEQQQQRQRASAQQKKR